MKLCLTFSDITQSFILWDDEIEDGICFLHNALLPKQKKTEFGMWCQLFNLKIVFPSQKFKI